MCIRDRVYGVSRTVVREALSKLQAAGLVETHHGVGTFVLQPSQFRTAGMFRLEGSDIATTVDVLAVLELRISLETETAGLAALRRSDEQLRGLREALDDFEANVAEMCIRDRAWATSARRVAAALPSSCSCSEKTPVSMPAIHWPGVAVAAMHAGISSVVHWRWPAVGDQRLMV